MFLLGQVVERSSDEEVLFSLHPRTESCSLLWRDGQAIGFYTVKHKGVVVDVGVKQQCTILVHELNNAAFLVLLENQFSLQRCCGGTPL